MKINYKIFSEFLVFFLVFMIFQYLLLITELEHYLDMITDIQGYKFNFYKNLECNFTFKSISIFLFGYVVVCFMLYYYIIISKKTLLEGFIFISILYSFWDVCLFNMFDKAVKYYPLLLYDIYIVGGVCMVVSQYIVYNYTNILQKYIPLLFLLYISTMLWFFYECYRYNPNLSNIKGVVLF